MEITLTITNRSHRKALSLARQQYNESQAANVAAINAALPKMFSGSGGKAQRHPNEVTFTPLTAEDHLLQFITEQLDQLAKAHDTDPAVYDEQITQAQKRKDAAAAKLAD